MTDRYLIAIDLDGTLLRDDKTISERTKRVLKQVKKEGHLVMISTGRPYRSSEMYYRELGLDTPIVNFNGAFVHHPLDPDWGIFHEPIAISMVKSIIEMCIQYNFSNMIAEVIDRVFIHSHDEKLLDIFLMGNPNVTTGDLRTFLKDDPTSLLIYAEKTQLDKIRDFLNGAFAEAIEHRSWAYPYDVIEVNKRGVNKAAGVKMVADSYGIPRERIIAFGDEDNDLEMLRFAKYGVAMANGIDAAKEVASSVTLSNEEDGVAVYLEKMLLA
jgi:HAD-superfamily hydrolase, subfamily IIB